MIVVCNWLINHACMPNHACPLHASLRTRAAVRAQDLHACEPLCSSLFTLGGPELPFPLDSSSRRFCMPSFDRLAYRTQPFYDPSTVRKAGAEVGGDTPPVRMAPTPAVASIRKPPVNVRCACMTRANRVRAWRRYITREVCWTCLPTSQAAR